MEPKVKGIRTALIGEGRWGKNIRRELEALTDLRAVAHDEDGVLKIMENKEIDAVAIATPIGTHFDIARRMLLSGKHAFVEKPIAERYSQAQELAKIALEKNLRLMAGYIFLYHPVFEELKNRLQDQKISRVEFEWEKFGTFDEPIEANLLTHHLALACDLLGQPISAEYLLRENDKLMAELSYKNALAVSKIDRRSEKKRHVITVNAEKKYVWDNTELFEDGKKIFKSADQPLARELAEFIDSVRMGGDKPSSGDFGARVLRIHELLL